MTIRSTLLLCDGLREVERINQSGSYTANLLSENKQNTDTNNGLPDTDTISDDAFNRVYDFMNEHTDYVLYSDGYIAHLSQIPSGEVSVTYLNKQYYQLADFPLYQGTALNFDYPDGENAQEIPVLVRYGVGEKYPVGSSFTIDDFSTGKMRRFRVQGVLEKDNVSSLFYAPDFKRFNNFSIIVPFTAKSLKTTGKDLRINALTNVVILRSRDSSMTTESVVKKLSKLIHNELHMEINFYSAHDNTSYWYEEFIMPRRKSIALCIVACILLWVMMFWLIGQYAKLQEGAHNLRRLLYKKFSVIIALPCVALYCAEAISQYSEWMLSEIYGSTYGFMGILPVGWAALLGAAVIQIGISLLVCEWIIRRQRTVKKRNS